jgi:hypothetical protein
MNQLISDIFPRKLISPQFDSLVKYSRYAFQRFFIYETNFRETLLPIWMQNKGKLYHPPELIYTALMELFHETPK